jgi:hypothetical protein
MCSVAGERILITGSGVRPTGPLRTGEQRKEHAMTTPSMTRSIPLHQTMGRSLRTLLTALALVVLVTVAFVVGRVTVGSSTPPAHAAAVHTQAPASSADTGRVCQVGHLRGPC